MGDYFMLEITISDSDKKVLEDTNIFSNNNIMSFCLLLCFGGIKDIEKQKERKIGWIKINVYDKLTELKEMITKYSSVRIWYSSKDNEDVCNVLYLINYLSSYNISIYLCDIYRSDKYYLSSYNKEEIEELTKKSIRLNDKDINCCKEIWSTLVKENKDIRVVESNIKSYSYNYLDKKIIDILKQNKEIRYWSLVGECLSKRLAGFAMDACFQERIDSLINRNIIKTVRKVKEKNAFGEAVEVVYLSGN